MKLISFIIPHYNLSRELLMRCVKSIIDQAMPKESYEIIVVDDGSDIPPLWLTQTFDNDIIRTFVIEHGGPGAARNKGIEEAEGQYIQFIDADDCLRPNALSPCLEVLRTEQPKILRFKYRICTNEKAISETIENKEVKFGHTVSGAVFMERNNLPGSPCTYIFERNVAIKHGIRFATNVYHEDDEFNTKLHYYATSLIDSNAVIYNYCIRKESITSNSNPEFEKQRIEDLFALLERVIAFRDEHKDTSNTIQKRALERKLTMLTVDTIMNLLYDKRSAGDIYKTCRTRLAEQSLYPLPKASYSLKYKIFRLFANSHIGLMFLRMSIPGKKPTRK